MRASDLPPDQVTLAELVRWLGRIEREVDGLKFVPNDRYEPEQLALKQQIARVEADMRDVKSEVTWSRRAQYGTLLTVLASTLLLYLQSAGRL